MFALAGCNEAAGRMDESLSRRQKRNTHSLAPHRSAAPGAGLHQGRPEPASRGRLVTIETDADSVGRSGCQSKEQKIAEKIREKDASK